MLDNSKICAFEGGSEAELLAAELLGAEAGDGSGQPTGGDSMQDAAAFMRQVPPNWEKAEKHGEANLVLDSTKTELNMEDPDSFCPCCQLPYPNEEAYLEINVNNLDLGFLGPGFPLFFVLMKLLCIYLFILCIIYFLPVALAITKALDDLEGTEFFIESSVAMFSYGAFIVGTPRSDGLGTSESAELDF